MAINRSRRFQDSAPLGFGHGIERIGGGGYPGHGPDYIPIWEYVKGRNEREMLLFIDWSGLELSPAPLD